MNFRIGQTAAEEFVTILLHYESGSPEVADRFLRRYDDAVDRLLANPGLYPLWEELRGGREIRHVSLDRFPYSLIYEIRGEDLILLAIWHQQSRAQDWRRRER